MRWSPADKEDIKQEKALASLLGVKFSKSALFEKYHPRHEVAAADPETLNDAANTASDFSHDLAAARNEELAPLLRKLRQRMTVKQIAAELTRRKVPKAQPWAAGKPWCRTSVDAVLYSLGITRSVRDSKARAAEQASFARKRVKDTDKRNADLRAMLLVWCASGMSQRHIADELTKLNASKVNNGKGPWTQVGVCKVLKRMGIKTTHEQGWRHKAKAARHSATTA
jgi:hypothetical protein